MAPQAMADAAAGASPRTSQIANPASVAPTNAKPSATVVAVGDAGSASADAGAPNSPGTASAPPTVVTSRVRNARASTTPAETTAPNHRAPSGTPAVGLLAG